MKGFIALISAIIISAILLVVVIGGNITGLFTRFNILDAELKQHSAALVDACVDTILSRLENDSSYTGSPSETIPVNDITGSYTCSILGSTSAGGTLRIYSVQAVYQHAYTDALVTIDTNSVSISSWKEVGTF